LAGVSLSWVKGEIGVFARGGLSNHSEGLSTIQKVRLPEITPVVHVNLIG